MATIGTLYSIGAMVLPIQIPIFLCRCRLPRTQQLVQVSPIIVELTLHFYTIRLVSPFTWIWLGYHLVVIPISALFLLLIVVMEWMWMPSDLCREATSYEKKVRQRNCLTFFVDFS